MIGVDYVYFIQKNHLDLKNRLLEIEATNETFAARVGVVEKCKYYVHPENPEWTCFEQSALLDVKNFFGLENTVEKIAMKQYAANIAKGKELIEVFMKEVNAGGVTDLRPWKASDPAHNRELRRVVSRGTEPLSPRPIAEAKRLSIAGPSHTVTQANLGINWTRQSDTQDISKHVPDSRSNISDQKSSQKLLRSRSKSDVNTKEPEQNKSDAMRGQNLHIPRSKQKYENNSLSIDSKRSSILRTLSLSRTKSKQNVEESLSSEAKERLLSNLNLNKEKQKIEDLSCTSSEETEKKLADCLSLSRRNNAIKDSDKDQLLLGKTSLNIKDTDSGKNWSTSYVCDPPDAQNAIVGYITRWDNLVIVLLCAMFVLLTLSSPLSFFFGRRLDRSS
ncbi:jg11715 [Pararge aegeria aegeria]|uniref:Jg11715 protein n=1 Tax=Pararge aegeria aegeria TaxID=348720 RepID=A0A8S4RZY1_9NEOP|nr:jg11715 [Pararge aegeria aegeria]